MTDNGIKMAQTEEMIRHNKEMERLEKMKKMIEGAAGAGQAIGSLIALLQDADWYKRIDSLVDSVTRIPFYRKKGRPFWTSGDYATDFVIMKHRWAPTIGTVKGALENAPVMIALKELFAAVRGENSGATNYDAVDLGLVDIAIDSIVTLWFETLRALRMAAKTEEMSPFTRRQLVDCASNWNTDILNECREQYISILNKVAQDLNTLFIPGNLSYYAKHKFLAESVFCEYDGTSDIKLRQTFHMFQCGGYFVYDEANGELDFNDWPAGTRTPQYLQGIFNAMITPLLHSSAVEIMTGDIKRAVQMGRISESALFKLPGVTLEDTYGQCFVYSEDMLWQIRNENVLPPIYNGSRSTEFSIHQIAISGVPYIYQGTLDTGNKPVGIRLTNPVNGVTSGDIADYTVLGKGRLFKSDHDTPSVDEILVGSRLMYETELDTEDASNLGSLTNLTLRSHGSEVVYEVTASGYMNNTAANNDQIQTYVLNGYYNCSSVTVLAKLLPVIAQFKYAPRLVLQQRSIVGFYPFMNNAAYNSLLFNEDSIKALHECALRSQFCFDFKGSASVNTDDTKKGNSKPKNKGKRGKKGKKPAKKDEETGNK